MIKQISFRLYQASETCIIIIRNMILRYLQQEKLRVGQAVLVLYHYCVVYLHVYR